MLFLINLRPPQPLRKLPCAPATAESEATGHAVVVLDRRRIAVEGLRVADASILPNATSGKLNASCLVMGTKELQT